MRHTHLLSKLSLAIAVIATVGICQSSFSSPGPIGPIIFAEEATGGAIILAPATEPFAFPVFDEIASSDMIAPLPSTTQQSTIFPMIWSWMQTYPAWAGFFCVAILSSLVYFLQTMLGVETTTTEELADSFMENKPSFSQAMPEVEVHEEAMQEDSYESSYDSDAETESQTEEPKVTVSQLD